MRKFSDFANGKGENVGGGNAERGGQKGNILDLVTALAKEYDGKNADALLTAIYKEAKKGKKQGTLKNSDLDAFSSLIAPFLDDEKKKIMFRLIADLKKI